MAASLPAACRGLTIVDQQSAAALGSLSSSYGFVGVPARNADLAGPLVLRIREKETDAPDQKRLRSRLGNEREQRGGRVPGPRGRSDARRRGGGSTIPVHGALSAVPSNRYLGEYTPVLYCSSRPQGVD